MFRSSIEYVARVIAAELKIWATDSGVTDGALMNAFLPCLCALAGVSRHIDLRTSLERLMVPWKAEPTRWKANMSSIGRYFRLAARNSERPDKSHAAVVAVPAGLCDEHGQLL